MLTSPLREVCNQVHVAREVHIHVYADAFVTDGLRIRIQNHNFIATSDRDVGLRVVGVGILLVARHELFSAQDTFRFLSSDTLTVIVPRSSLNANAGGSRRQIVC